MTTLLHLSFTRIVFITFDIFPCEIVLLANYPVGKILQIILESGPDKRFSRKIFILSCTLPLDWCTSVKTGNVVRIYQPI